MSKQCRSCGQVKAEDEFYTVRIQSSPKVYRRGVCKKCFNAQCRSPEQRRQASRRARHKAKVQQEIRTQIALDLARKYPADFVAAVTELADKYALEDLAEALGPAADFVATSPTND